MKKTGSWILGLTLVIVGAVLVWNALGIANIDIFFPGWWTLFIIVPSIIALFKDDDKTGAIVGMIIGVFLLLCCLGVMVFSLVWKLILPVILVGVGVSIIVRNISQGQTVKEMNDIQEAEVVDDKSESSKGTQYEYSAMFGSQKVNFEGDDFVGCKAEAIFGAVTLDLRKAKLKKDAVVRVGSYFGGVVVLVPEEWHVKVVSRPLFGGVSDNRKTNDDDKKTAKEKATTLYIDAMCVFGGVEIK